MNTKHRILSVLLILAMVATLCVVMAAPAAATADSVSAVTVTLVNAGGTGATGVVLGTTVPTGVASTYTEYDIRFITPQTMVAGTDSITITFPTYSTVPATWTTAANVTVSSTTHGTTNDGAAVTTLGYSIIVPVSGAAGVVDCVAGEIVTVKVGVTSATEVIKNTSVLGAQTIKVRTTMDTIDATSNTFNIYGISVSGFNIPAQYKTAKNTPLTVVGQGFTPGAAVDLKIATVNISQATVGADGTFTGTLYAAIPGPITAVDGAGVSYNAGPTILLTGSLALAPASGLVNTTVQITASGLLVAGRKYTVSISGDATQIPNIITGGTASVAVGAYPATAADIAATASTAVFTLTIPAGTSAGVKTINLKDDTTAGGWATAAAYNADTLNLIASGTFTVGARSITLSPTSGQAGASIVVTGAGFEPSIAGTPSTANITFRDVNGLGGATNLLGTAASIGADGTFTAIVVVPTGSAVGTGSMTATSYIGGALQSTASASFTKVSPGVTVSPTTGAPGSQVTITGAGFAAQQLVTTLTIGGVTILPSGTTLLTNALGGFTYTGVVPGLGSGIAAVVVAVGGVAAPVPSYFTINASTVSVTGGLSSVMSNVQVVWTFDAATQGWQLYDTTAGATNTMTTLTKGQGYYIQIANPCTLIYGGNSYNLVKGWNLIGWLG